MNIKYIRLILMLRLYTSTDKQTLHHLVVLREVKMSFNIIIVLIMVTK